MGLLDNKTTSERIKAMMAADGVTQVNMAEIIGVTDVTWRMRMKFNSWKLTELELIAGYFGRDLKELV